MPTLSSEQIVKGIRQGKPLSPFSIDTEVLDQYTEFVMAQNLTLNTDANDVLRLLHRLEPQLIYISAERRSLLAECEIFVLPFPLCISYAWEQRDRKIIVMGRGFVDLLANAIHGALLQGMLPQELNEAYRQVYDRTLPATELLANALFLLQLRYYQFCEPLPNVSALLSPDTHEQSDISISGALMFTLLHELGHHELGHIDKEQIRPMRFEQISDESLSADQHQEMEADAFALESLIEPARVMGPYWQQQAVNFFIQMELVSGRHSGEGHPLSLNRAFYADTVRSTLRQVDDAPSRRPFFKELAVRYKDTEEHVKAGENALVKTTREGCLRVLGEINDVLKDFDIDLRPVWTTSYPSWLDRPFNEAEP